MGVQLVVLDGDGVIWDHQDISGLTLPFKLIDENTVMDAEGKSVHLTKGIRELLKGLVTRGVIVALASWNKPEYVTQALHLFNIHQYFQFIEAQFHPNKHLMIREILRKLERKGVKPRPR